MPSPIAERSASGREDDQLEDRFPQYIHRVEGLLSSFRFWCAICLFLAGIHAWPYRHSMNPDGLSYLDMASEALHGGPQNLVSGYWSPAYPALISLAFFVFRPSPILEFPLIHFVNLAVFCFVLLSFTFFLKSWLALHRDDPSAKEEKPYTISFCFCVFLWFTIDFITLRVVTPDLYVAGIVFLTGGICCRISLPGSSWRHFVALGGILGLGYYVKAAVLPLGLILIAILFRWPASHSHSRFKMLLSGLVFLIVAAPLVALVSSRLGHLSIGDTGPLSYAWYANALPRYVGWTGGIADAHGTPNHPPRTLLGKPTILEFADPVKGTYPLWYDPSYWYAGARVRFDLRGQLTALKKSLIFYSSVFGRMAILFAGALLLLIYAVRQKRFATPDRDFRWLLTWPITACVMYAVVHAESRFLGAFFVLFWLQLYRVLWRSVADVVRAVVLGTVTCTLLILLTVSAVAAGARTVRSMMRLDQPEYVQVAMALQAAGVRRGDRLATVGNAFDAYYARYVGARVTAHIVEASEVRYLSAEDLGRVRERLASIGVKALVTTERPVNATSDGWKDIMVSGSPRYSIMLVTTSSPTRK